MQCGTAVVRGPRAPAEHSTGAAITADDLGALGALAVEREEQGIHADGCMGLRPLEALATCRHVWVQEGRRRTVSGRPMTEKRPGAGGA